MAVITAKGKKDARLLHVLCEVEGARTRFAFNGEENIGFEEEIIGLSMGNTPIGGTYYPQTLALKIVGVLTSGFFDLPPDRVDVIGDIEQIPYEEGVIY